MTVIFLRILNMSITASYIILAVLLLRLALARAPRKYSYWLWLAAGFRLSCPVSLTSAFSLLRLRPAAATATIDATLSAPAASLSTSVQPQLSPAASAVSDGLSAAPAPGWLTLAAWLWCAGLAALLLWGLYCDLCLGRRLTKAIRREGNIWQCETVSSPFIRGLFRPRIYLPYDLAGSDWDYVLRHERCHLRRLDHLVKPLAYLLLAVHWFNPLVWLAFTLLGRDMELCCDEMVLAQAGSGKQAYSAVLLSFAAPCRAPLSGPLAFGETGVRRRIKNALGFRPASRPLRLAAALFCAVALAACALDPPPEAAAPSDPAAALTVGEVYQSVECIYMNPLSSYAGVNGDSGYSYLIDSQAQTFDIVSKHDDQVQHFTDVSWNYSQFDAEDWAGWFGEFFGFNAPDISGYDKTLMFDLSFRYRVLNMDGQLWLMTRGSNREMGDFVWSVYRLEPEQASPVSSYRFLPI